MTPAGKSPIVFDDKLVRQVAQLSRLDLTDAEVSLFASQMAQVLGHIDKLSEVNVQGVEPMTHPFDLAPALREDRVQGHAPIVDGAYVVPQFR